MFCITSHTMLESTQSNEENMGYMANKWTAGSGVGVDKLQTPRFLYMHTVTPKRSFRTTILFNKNGHEKKHGTCMSLHMYNY